MLPALAALLYCGPSAPLGTPRTRTSRSRPRRGGGQPCRLKQTSGEARRVLGALLSPSNRPNPSQGETSAGGRHWPGVRAPLGTEASRPSRTGRYSATGFAVIPAKPAALPASSPRGRRPPADQAPWPRTRISNTTSQLAGVPSPSAGAAIAAFWRYPPGEAHRPRPGTPDAPCARDAAGPASRRARDGLSPAESVPARASAGRRLMLLPGAAASTAP